MISYKRICGGLILLLCVLWAGTGVRAAEQDAIWQYLEDIGCADSVYEVIPDGSGDFSGIQEAVEAVESGATLLIHPGIYEENVEILNKTVNLVGTGREDCILLSNTANYHHIPLTISAGVVCNMTVCGLNPSGENIVSAVEGEYDIWNPESLYAWQDRFPGYTIHIDSDYSYGRELLVQGCRIISDSSFCVGMGSRGENTVTFSDCQFISNGGGCIFLHNMQNEFGDGEARFIMRDCELENYLSPYVMSVHSMGEQNPVYLTFQNVSVSTVAYEITWPYSSENMNTWYSIDELNLPEVRSRLEAQGYYSALEGELIHSCDSREAVELLQNKDLGSLLADRFDFEEGICYIALPDSISADMTQEIASEEPAARQVIEIMNVSPDAPKDGWCGLSRFYLTEESCGNTLIEMNYPRAEGR
ncbi:MAG: pectinesterase family protein [Lachnospiraceae bacterium]|nr:pectinesterase family protein [Lachnospiraceae bacterium]